MKTVSIKQSEINRKWHLIDAQGQTLGRMATTIASLLIGKAKTSYSPHMDNGDYVVVINAAQVAVTGNKLNTKIYRHHTGRPGGFREFTMQEVQTKDPCSIITRAVNGMVPKNKLRDPRLKRLKVFTDATHPYAQHINQKAK